MERREIALETAALNRNAAKEYKHKCTSEEAARVQPGELADAYIAFQDRDRTRTFFFYRALIRHADAHARGER